MNLVIRVTVKSVPNEVLCGLLALEIHSNKYKSSGFGSFFTIKAAEFVDL